MELKFARTLEEQDAQLTLWGLARDPIIEAVIHAQSYYTQSTLLHPRGYQFISAYAECGKRLRENFIPLGWKKCDLNNQTAIRHEGLMLRIAPCNFDSATADESRQPRNISQKGFAASANTSDNEQLCLFGGGLPRVARNAAIPMLKGYTTLILAMNFEEDFPKAEVSLPTKFENGRYTTFINRVPLLDGRRPRNEPIAPHQTNETFGEVEIPIREVS
ncbi:hypothetical protein M2305_002257 [Gluconobacter cerinus]|nr:hypothetical protein [Gluconobacter cerinus]MCW2266310.1 hypothetical protein [Gluconobacter cerinus]